MDGSQLIGNITNQTIWKFNRGTVLTDIRVNDGASLTIDAGTELLFVADTELIVEKKR